MNSAHPQRTSPYAIEWHLREYGSRPAAQALRPAAAMRPARNERPVPGRPAQEAA